MRSISVTPLLVAAASAVATLPPVPAPTWTPNMVPNPAPTLVDLLAVRSWLNWEPTTDDDNLISYRMIITVVLFVGCALPFFCCTLIYLFGPEEGPRERRLKAEAMDELDLLMKQGRTLSEAEAARVKALMTALRPGAPLKEVEALKCVTSNQREKDRVAKEVERQARGGGSGTLRPEGSSGSDSADRAAAKSRRKAAASFAKDTAKDATEGRKRRVSFGSIDDEGAVGLDLGDPLEENFEIGARKAHTS